MTSNIDRIRLFVFRVWFVTLAVVVLAFAERVSGLRQVKPPFASVFQGFQMMVGLIVPQIGVMAAFYFNLDRHKETITNLTNEQMSVITWLSISYHALFIASIIFGIVFYGFDQKADGGALQRNAADIVLIMGLFSVFLAPVVFLFARPQSSRQMVPGSAQPKSEVDT